MIQQSVLENQNISSIRFWSKYLFSKKLLIMGITIMGFVVGVVFFKFQDPTYVAQLTFVPETETTGGLGSYSGIAAQFGIDIGSSGNIFEGDNIIELFKSNILIEKTFLTKFSYNNNKISLIDFYISNHKIDSKIKRLIKEHNIEFQPTLKNEETRLRDSILFLFIKGVSQGKLKVDRKDKKLNIIQVSMTDNDEIFVKNFVENLAANAISYYTDYKTKKAKQNVEVLQHQADSVKSILIGSITDVASLNDLNINPIKQIVRVGTQKKTIDVQTSTAIYIEILKNLELSKITLRKETPFIQIIDSPSFPLENKKKGMLFGGIVSGLFFFLLIIFFLVSKVLIKTIE